MSTVRIALANSRVPATPEDAVCLATSAIADASQRGALVICFPECFIPGYRWPGITAPPPDRLFLERAWAAVADAARTAGMTVVLGTERVTDSGLQASVSVFNSHGTVAGWQDKGQIDPDEEAIYPALGTERRVFAAGPLTLRRGDLPRRLASPGDCRWAVRRGAQVVFHPHPNVVQPGSYRPSTFADPANASHPGPRHRNRTAGGAFPDVADVIRLD